MCTASHNPKPYTGAKLVRDGALALSGDEGLQDIRVAIESGLGAAPGGGSVEQANLYDEFQSYVERFIDVERVRPLNVVLDGGNGMAGMMVGPLLERLGLHATAAYWTPDGNFPDHEPNPLLEKNRQFIVAQVRETGADLGIAWDGDARPLLFHRRHRRVRRRRLPHGAAREVAAGQGRTTGMHEPGPPAGDLATERPTASAGARRCCTTYARRERSRTRCRRPGESRT